MSRGSSTRSDVDFDVLIAGGGMVGASLALALSVTPWRIGLIEPAPLSSGENPSFDERATALSWSSRQFLHSVGLWETLADGASAIRHIHVSEQGRFGRSRLHADDLGVDTLGHVLPNRLLGQALSEHLAGCDNVSLIKAGVSAIQRPANSDEPVCVRDSADREWRADLVVVADGARSRLRDALGIPAQTVRFPHVALVANLEVERPHQGWAFERFTPQGPMALLPLPEADGVRHRMNLVMSLAREEAEACQQMDASRLLGELRARFGSHLGAFRAIGERSVYPLFQVRARRLVDERVVLAGNAAMSLHPVAGQGFNLALRGIGDLAERLIETAAQSGDPGSPTLLQTHARERDRDIAWTGSWTRGLVEGFTLALPGVGPLRSTALLGLDRLGPLRRWFVRQAMGRKVGLSRLSRGVAPRR